MSKVLIFDFDGTIADSLDAMVHIMNRFSHRFGYKHITEEMRDSLRHETSQKILSEFNLSPWRLLWIALRVKAEMHKQVANIHLIDGMKTAIRQLKADGYTLGVATSNSKVTVEQFLAKHHLTDCFDFVFARTVFNKATLLKAILRHFRFPPKNVWYIGDETRDIDAARVAGVGIVSVTWGMNSAEILKSHQPDHIVTEPASIHRVLS